MFSFVYAFLGNRNNDNNNIPAHTVKCVVSYPQKGKKMKKRSYFG